MKKVLEKLLPLVKGFVLCGVFLQIVLGILYIGSNISRVPAYWETTIYSEIAEKFILDEYMTGLYPLLIKVCKGISFIPYQIPIYLLQILLGLFCVYKIAMGWIGNRKMSVICALWINTLPFVTQAHVTVLPNSFVWTILMVLVSIVSEATYHKKAVHFKEWTYLLVGFTLICQLDNSYLIPALVLLIWATNLQLYYGSKKIRFLLFGIVSCIGVTVCNLGVHYLTQTPGYYGRMQRSVEAAFFQRVGTSIMEDKYFPYMPVEIQYIFMGKELDAFQKYPYQLQRNFGPTLEARYGKERANELYLELGRLGFENATKETVYDIVTDTLNYAFPLGMYKTWENDGAMGATSWNYQQFIEKVPELSAFYMHASWFVWSVGFLASIIAGILTFGTQHKNGVRLGTYLVSYVLIYGAFFALRGTGIYDYKLALLPLAISQIPVCYSGVRYLFKQ